MLKKLFTNWKNSLKLKSDEKVKQQIQELTPPESARPRPSYDVLIDVIKRIYHGEAYGEYVAGTLTFKVHYPGIGPENEELIFCNFDEKEATPEYLFWLAMCYLKYKSPTTHHYPKAQKIVCKWPDQVFVAKELLCLS